MISKSMLWYGIVIYINLGKNDKTRLHSMSWAVTDTMYNAQTYYPYEIFVHKYNPIC